MVIGSQINTYIKMDSRVVISFAIAGCISSIIDRIWNGGVINYINIPNFTSLNLGYVYILLADEINCYDLVNANTVVVEEAAIKEIEEALK
mgnify:CR=1 FL=1